MERPGDTPLSATADGEDTIDPTDRRDSWCVSLSGRPAPQPLEFASMGLEPLICMAPCCCCCWDWPAALTRLELLLLEGCLAIKGCNGPGSRPAPAGGRQRPFSSRSGRMRRGPSC